MGAKPFSINPFCNSRTNSINGNTASKSLPDKEGEVAPIKAAAEATIAANSSQVKASKSVDRATKQSFGLQNPMVRIIFTLKGKVTFLKFVCWYYSQKVITSMAVLVYISITDI